MSKTTVEIEDSLDEWVDGATSEVEDLLRNYLESNKSDSCLECPDIGDLDNNGGIHEIVDSAVPIYTSEIRDAWYLYSNELESAYRDAGIGDGTEENHQAVAIYCYIQQEVYSWWHDNAEDIFQEFVEKLVQERGEEEEDEDENDEDGDTEAQVGGKDET